MGHPEVPEGTPPENLDGVTFTRSDLVKLRKALAEGWRVPDVILNETLYQVAAILAATGGKRLKLAAARVLVQMTRVDLAQNRKSSHANPDAQALRELFRDAAGHDSEPATDPPEPGEGLRGDGG